MGALLCKAGTPVQNAISLRLRCRLVELPGDGAAPPVYLTTLLNNIERLIGLILAEYL